MWVAVGVARVGERWPGVGSVSVAMWAVVVGHCVSAALCGGRWVRLLLCKPLWGSCVEVRWVCGCGSVLRVGCEALVSLWLSVHGAL